MTSDYKGNVGSWVRSWNRGFKGRTGKISTESLVYRTHHMDVNVLFLITGPRSCKMVTSGDAGGKVLEELNVLPLQLFCKRIFQNKKVFKSC